MKKLLANLPRKPLAFISLGSLLMTGKIAVANETAKKVQPVERPDANVTPVSGESQKACVRHSKFGTFFCANANQLSHLKKVIHKLMLPMKIIRMRYLVLQMKKVMLL